MGSVELDGVTKVFGDDDDDIVANDDISLSIEDGEFIVFVGPSGSGKSTLLRLIAGLEEVTEGEIRIDGDDVTNVKPKNRDIAMVFQNYALYPHLNVEKNIGFGLRMQGNHSTVEIEERVADAAEMLSIGELLDNRPSELSGGQKQRVALGRAIVREPSVFLMDEPLSNLDAKLRATMRTEIQKLQRDLGVTTIYVTHDQTEAMTMGDRIVIMNEGQLQQVATPMEAYYEPRNMFVAGFIGEPSMNFFDMRVADGQLRVIDGQIAINHDIEALANVDADRVVVGIRPEDVEFREEPGADTFSVTVDVVEPLGKDKLLYFTVAGQEYVALVEGTNHVDEGRTVHFRFPPEAIHVFDAASGAAIKNYDRSRSEPPTGASVGGTS